jgi:hypothetical protein
MVFGSIEHYTWNYICGRGELNIDTTAEQITELLWNGLHTTEASSSLQKETQRLAQIASRIEKALPKVQRAQK